MIAWFDMDGTLADDRWRRHHALHPDGATILDHPNWGAYLAGEAEDPPVAGILDIFKAHWAAPDATVWIVTGRLLVNEPTLRGWMERHGVLKDYKTAMRADPTMDPLDFKAGLLEAMDWIGLRPDVVYDDRDDMLDLFRRHGVGEVVDAKQYWENTQ